MARAYPPHRLQQTSNGWKQNFNVSRVLEETMANVVSINDSAISYPNIVCQPSQDYHPGIFYGENPLLHSFSGLMFNLVLITTITRIGGVIVGPSFLGRNRWYQRHMITDSTKFLMNNLGVMGFMFFLFIYGVKMDPSLLKKSGRFHVSTALFGITIPSFVVFIVALYMRKNMDNELSKISSIGVLSGYLGITAFPVLYHILQELNLLNSEMGRMALSVALIGDAFGVGLVVAFEAGSQGESKTQNALWYMVTLVALALFILFCVRPAMMWINNKTPEGHPVNQTFVVAIFLGVFVMGFITDMFGMAIANGPLWLGLAVPDGPRLGATLIERSNTIMTDFLLPFSFFLVGSYTDFYAMSASSWSSLAPLFVMVLLGYLIKFFATWIALFYWRMPLRDGLTLSLIMSLRGQLELMLFVHLIDKRVLKVPGFTLLLLMTTVLTATFTPLISTLYDPTRPYMVNQRRNIQHNPPTQELRIVLCILDTETINSLIHLVDISNPTSNSPLSVSALRLIELVGRASPLFIDHEKQELPHIYHWTHTMNALEHYKKFKGVFVKLRFFTAVAPKQTMFQDTCELALEQEASLIILPFNRGAIYNHGVRAVNSKILNHAPCSVAILVNKGLLEINTLGNSFRHSAGNRFAVLFLGGADAREALVYADRMLANTDQEVNLTVIRFLSHNYIGDNEMEKKLDDGIVTWFWVKNEANQRMTYREVVVRNGEETISAIQSMNDGAYDLWIVGRKQGINAVLLTGLSEWNVESEDLGVIGEYVSSEDFPGTASVLVVQQQILRG
ncbi:cation/H(+) antiporter 24 isoform X2 [Abrus precatorius]|uniref:Cation/H(+) antiporter 24 isoform X2 n=1 Tax=Abrus precatorius TaxID=3816 RepID=A0A8B8JTU7_ABRPR|nr:cation/H(+) antiporter 24 isoform X2 [Abrus precatorius]